MDPTITTYPTDDATVPRCPEDALLTLTTTTDASGATTATILCGPARDDRPDVVLDLYGDGDCSWLIGQGEFEHGLWSSLACGVVVREDASSSTLPDTSVPAPASGGLGDGLTGVVVLIVLAMAQLVGRRRTR